MSRSKNCCEDAEENQKMQNGTGFLGRLDGADNQRRPSHNLDSTPLLRHHLKTAGDLTFVGQIVRRYRVL